jgi:hypothetical protein
MVNLKEISSQLSVNSEIMRSLVQTITDEQAQWKPTPETWCMQQVMEHVFNEERLDFRLHIEEILSKPPQAWGTRKAAYIHVEKCQQALQAFLTEREASIKWLNALPSPDWNIATKVSFGPSGEVMVLKAGDVLVSWAAHDYLHIRQMNELLYGWNEKMASPFSVQYAGGW